MCTCVSGCLYPCTQLYASLDVKHLVYFNVFIHAEGIQCSECAKCVAVCVRICWYRLTELAHFQYLAQHLGQLDAAAAEWTLVFVFSTAVLQDNLETRRYKISQARNKDVFPRGYKTKQDISGECVAWRLKKSSLPRLIKKLNVP